MRPDPSNSVPSFSHPESDSPGGPVPRSSGPAATAPPARSRRRRCLLAVGVVTLVLSAVLGRPVLHLAGTAWRDAPPGQFAVPAGHADDVSHLNLTPVAEVWMIPETAEEAEGQLRELLQRARETGRRVSVAGARHSMGGHTLYPDGIVVDMRPLRAMRVDPESRRLTVGAGAIWTDVLRHLDDAGLSVEVMQSDSAFTVGGSLSVNCHGWQFGRPPIASTVDSFRLMLADGSVVRCSRTENSELFSLTLGGYGLFGIILEADLRVVPNVRLRLQQEQVATTTASALLDRLRQEPHPALVYARLNVTTDRRFGQVRVSAYYPDTNGTVPALREPGMPGLSRAVFRGSAGSDYGKSLRWFAETRVQPYLLPEFVSRNRLLIETPDWYLNRNTNATDILHEYFLPRAGALGFLEQADRIIKHHGGDLLNTTVRDVAADSDTFLRYAREPVIAFVMFFHQARTPGGEDRMETMTRQLIDAALAMDGCYYLPYRLHATPEQFHRAYPQARAFFERKRAYDPDELFQNRFYLRYGLSEEPPAGAP